MALAVVLCKCGHHSRVHHSDWKKGKHVSVCYMCDCKLFRLKKVVDIFLPEEPECPSET